jgi:hypothetical protein
MGCSSKLLLPVVLAPLHLLHLLPPQHLLLLPLLPVLLPLQLLVLLLGCIPGGPRGAGLRHRGQP